MIISLDLNNKTRHTNLKKKTSFVLIKSVSNKSKTIAITRVKVQIIFKSNFLCVFLALPEVKTFDIDEDWEFMVLACDGIWDVLTNQVNLYLKHSFHSYLI